MAPSSFYGRPRNSGGPRPSRAPICGATRRDGRRWRRPWSARLIWCSAAAASRREQIGLRRRRRDTRRNPALAAAVAGQHRLGQFTHARLASPREVATACFASRDLVIDDGCRIVDADATAGRTLLGRPHEPRRVQEAVGHVAQRRQPAPDEDAARVLVLALLDRVVDARNVDAGDTASRDCGRRWV